MDTLLVSTAIPFVNGAPHLGHALEFVQTDVLARHVRARGDAVYLLTGTDEHAVKNVHAAAAAGRPVGEFVATQRGAVSLADRRARGLVRRLHPDQFGSAAPTGCRGAVAPGRAARRPVPRAIRGLVLQRVRGVPRSAVPGARRAVGAGSRGELVLPPVAVRARDPRPDSRRAVAHRAAGAAQRGARFPRG